MAHNNFSGKRWTEQAILRALINGGKIIFNKGIPYNKNLAGRKNVYEGAEIIDPENPNAEHRDSIGENILGLLVDAKIINKFGRPIAGTRKTEFTLHPELEGKSEKEVFQRLNDYKIKTGPGLMKDLYGRNKG